MCAGPRLKVVVVVEFVGTIYGVVMLSEVDKWHEKRHSGLTRRNYDATGGNDGGCPGVRLSRFGLQNQSLGLR